MSEVASEPSGDEKPVVAVDAVDFPPFPEPEDGDFEEDVGEEEREYYKSKFPDLNLVKTSKLHCSACDRHLGCAAKNDSKMRMHPMLRTLVCHTCHTFYNSGEFDKGEDGSELYCRWCGQGGQVYCCSDCIHVFCAKCIKRNFGIAKIREIENTDDWKCFKCSPRPLWDHRALCWALLRYCDLRNKLVYKTQDPDLKEKYQKDCAVDYSECCKDKKRRGPLPKKKEEVKKEKEDKKPSAASIISKIPPTIQVKKFASINLEESPPVQRPEKKKRSGSPKSKPTVMKNPISIAPYVKPITIFPSPAKRMKFPMPPMGNQFGGNVQERNKFMNYTPRLIRPKAPHQPPPYLHNYYMQQQQPQHFNGYNNMVQNIADNINLSLEELTQGLDMAAVTSMANAHKQKNPDDDVVCTPDFPLEPLCEVTEEHDDDVQCMTPGPVAVPKPAAPAPRQVTLPDLSSENIVQMTENDVTVNAVTGGLKFRVDPQTLSSNKMYRLPDGRIFAINANPNMPGGYSATIVAVTENQSTPKALPKGGATYAAKLSAVPAKSTPTPPPLTRINNRNRKSNLSQNNTPKETGAKITKINKSTPDTGNRQCDLEIPVEWYRYNVIDAVDALEYSLTRLRKLKKEATTLYLRTRTVDEMRHLHKSLVRLLNNSAVRFNEVRDNLNKGMKQYLNKKANGPRTDDEDDDDDVEILNEQPDDPIFIDENSIDSITASRNESQDVELVSSDLNDSGEKDPKRRSSKTAKKTNGAPGNINHDEDCDEVITGDITHEIVDKEKREQPDKSSMLKKALLDLSSDQSDAGPTEEDKVNGNDEDEHENDSHIATSNEIDAETEETDKSVKQKDGNDITENKDTENEDKDDNDVSKNKDTENEDKDDYSENKDVEDDEDKDNDISKNKDVEDDKDNDISKNKDAIDKNDESENKKNEDYMDTDETEGNKESEEERMETSEINDSKDVDADENDDSKDVDPDETTGDGDNTDETALLKESNDTEHQNNEKLQDTEMSDELIDTLLNDDTVEDVAQNLKSQEKDLIT